MAENKEAQSTTTAAPANTTAAAEAGDHEFQVYKERKGWVKDRDGRFHEVDDQQAFLQAYPGSEAVKSTDVDKNKVGYAKPKDDAQG